MSIIHGCTGDPCVYCGSGSGTPIDEQFMTANPDHHLTKKKRAASDPPEPKDNKS